jgi:hypothetical protein
VEFVLFNKRFSIESDKVNTGCEGKPILNSVPRLLCNLKRVKSNYCRVSIDYCHYISCNL